MLHTGTVDGVTGSEVVRAVEHHIGSGHLFRQARAFEPLMERNDATFRVDFAQLLATGGAYSRGDERKPA